MPLCQATRKIVRNAKLRNGDWQPEEADGGYPFIGCGEVSYSSTAIRLSFQSLGGFAAGRLLWWLCCWALVGFAAGRLLWWLLVHILLLCLCTGIIKWLFGYGTAWCTFIC